jgi:hypothetical protein
MNYLHKLLHGCHEASLLATRRREERLSWSQRLFVRIHLLVCSCCSQFVRQSERIETALQHFGRRLEEQPPFSADEKFKATLKERLK